MQGKKKVLVALSGGVDSAVAAALLKEQGYDVTGIFLQLWKAIEQEKTNTDLRDVKKIARHLSVPLEIIDVRERFRSSVAAYTMREYEIGRTPNPCVFCNKQLKIRVLLEERDRLGMDYVATGHYARIITKEQEFKINSHSSGEKSIYCLFKAKDKKKDQSYFLYTLGQEELSKLIFPLGEYEKPAARQLAKNYGLVVSDKVESQDICFLAGESMADFLRRFIDEKKGEIVDTQGTVLGVHKGLPFYTIGQRKGIEVGGSGPYYVLEKDFGSNRLIVARKAVKDLDTTQGIRLEQVNWIAGVPNLPISVLVSLRYHSVLAKGMVRLAETEKDDQKENRNYIVSLDELLVPVAPGQSAVFYSNEGEVIGGGVIT